MTLRNISDKDMRHCHFLKSTCDIGGPPPRAPLKNLMTGPTSSGDETFLNPSRYATGIASQQSYEGWPTGVAMQGWPGEDPPD